MELPILEQFDGQLITSVIFSSHSNASPQQLRPASLAVERKNPQPYLRRELRTVSQKRKTDFRNILPVSNPYRCIHANHSFYQRRVSPLIGNHGAKLSAAINNRIHKNNRFLWLWRLLLWPIRHSKAFLSSAKEYLRSREQFSGRGA